MIFERGNFYLESDFLVRIIREADDDLDIIIPVEDRTLNLYLKDSPDYLKSRIQFPLVKNIIIRFCILAESNTCTVHLLRNIDIHSSIVNFELDYSKNFIEVKREEYLTDFRIKSK